MDRGSCIVGEAMSQGLCALDGQGMEEGDQEIGQGSIPSHRPCCSRQGSADGKEELDRVETRGG